MPWPEGWQDPPSWTDGPLTASEVNDGLVNNMRVLGDPWTPYFVTLSSWGLVNGKLEGWYHQLGQFIRGRIEYTVGSSDTKSSAPVFSIPFPPISTTGAALGTAGLYDVSAANRAYRHVLYTSAGGGSLAVTAEDDTRLSPTVPWTWATGDQILLQFKYEWSV